MHFTFFISIISSFFIVSLQARNSDFDSSEYCNISADDVKTEIVSLFHTVLFLLLTLNKRILKLFIA